MLNHDELLPAEQENPAIIQALRKEYEMKPEEKQVLTRVHQRLAQSSYPLPEQAQAGNQARLLQFRPATATPLRPARARQRWLRPLNALAAVLILGLLVGSLIFTFAMIDRTNVGSPAPTTFDIRVFLVPAEQGSAPSHAELETASSILSQRFSNFGLKGFRVQVTANNGQPGILAELSHFGGNEQQTLNTLVETGALAFWDTGDTGVNAGTIFDPNQYTQYNPGGKPWFTGQNLDPNRIGVQYDSNTGQPLIGFAMKGSAVGDIATFTSQNIGKYLTITLDGTVLESAVINSALNGPGVIAGQFTQQQARAIVSALKSSTLPLELKQVA